MKYFITYLIPLSWLILLLNSCTGPKRPIFNEGRKAHVGDSISWKEVSYDDSHWKVRVPVQEKEVFWTRLPVEFPEEKGNRKQQGIMIGSSATYEAYWDGHLLGRNGRLGTSDEPEIAGKYIDFFPLPDSLVGSGKTSIGFKMYQSLSPSQPSCFFYH